jgi:activator of HSP90 ATPase
MNIKKLLYESFDRNLSKSEANKLKNALIKSESLKKEQSELSTFREVIFQNTQKDFSPDFEFEVLRKINSRTTRGSYQDIFFNSLNTTFRRLAYAVLIFIILTLSYNFEKNGNISFRSALGVKQQNSSLAEDFKNLFSIYN